MVDLRKVKKNYGSRLIIAGNLGVSDSHGVMNQGGPEEVEMAAKRALDAAMDDGMFWLSAGCEVHHALREENIMALTNSAKKYGSYRNG